MATSVPIDQDVLVPRRELVIVKQKAGVQRKHLGIVATRQGSVILSHSYADVHHSQVQLQYQLPAGYKTR